MIEIFKRSEAFGNAELYLRGLGLKSSESLLGVDLERANQTSMISLELNKIQSAEDRVTRNQVGLFHLFRWAPSPCSH